MRIPYTRRNDADYEEITFNAFGAVTAGTESGPYVPQRCGRLVLAVATFRAITSGSTVLSIKNNGAEIDTMTFTGTAYVPTSESFDLKFTPRLHSLTWGITTAPTGGEDLTILTRFI